MTRTATDMIREHVSIAPLTTWQVGGPAAFYAEPQSPDELALCLQFAADRQVPFLAIGGASNLLVSDAGFPGVVLRYANRRMELEDLGDQVRLHAASGLLLSPTAMRLANSGWAGLEWAAGIPGTFGGAIAGNAGAHGGDMAQSTESVEVFSLDRGVRRIPRAECGFGYRESRFKRHDSSDLVILGASFLLRREDPEALAATIRGIIEQRGSRIPPGYSAGSVFRNPPGDSAGRLIEAAGLKGESRGGARISGMHANFILNDGGTSADHILGLIRLARRRVMEDTGILLEPEIRLIGFGPHVQAEFCPGVED